MLALPTDSGSTDPKSSNPKMSLFDSVPLTADNQTGTDGQSRNEQIDPRSYLPQPTDSDTNQSNSKPDSDLEIQKREAQVENSARLTTPNRQLLTDDPEFKAKSDDLLAKKSSKQSRPTLDSQSTTAIPTQDIPKIDQIRQIFNLK